MIKPETLSVVHWAARISKYGKWKKMCWEKNPAFQSLYIPVTKQLLYITLKPKLFLLLVFNYAKISKALNIVLTFNKRIVRL